MTTERTRINTCRYCHKRAHRGYLIKYGTRSYVCVDCYTAHKTWGNAAQLPLHERRKLEKPQMLYIWPDNRLE
jgi:hypothetical protein